MTSVFIRRGVRDIQEGEHHVETDTERRQSHEDRGRDWNQA